MDLIHSSFTVRLDTSWQNLQALPSIADRKILFFGVGGSGRSPVSPPTPEGRGVRVDKGEQLFEEKLFERKIVSRKAT